MCLTVDFSGLILSGVSLSYMTQKVCVSWQIWKTFSHYFFEYFFSLFLSFQDTDDKHAI